MNEEPPIIEVQRIAWLSGDCWPIILAYQDGVPIHRTAAGVDGDYSHMNSNIASRIASTSSGSTERSHRALIRTHASR
jgi:hypothetical protein